MKRACEGVSGRQVVVDFAAKVIPVEIGALIEAVAGGVSKQAVTAIAYLECIYRRW